MPAMSTPAAIARITASGCTETQRPIRNGWSTWRLELLDADDDGEHQQRGDRAVGDQRDQHRDGAGDGGTDQRDEGAEEDQHADREHERHPEDRGADRDADGVDQRRRSRSPARTGSARSRRPGPSCRRGRGRRAATSRTTQAQIRSPSARKKYVENSTMKKPAKTCPTAVLTSVIRPTTSPSSDCSVIASWRPVDVVVDLRVAGVQRAVLEPVLDLVEPGDRLVGQVGGAGGDLLAGEGEQQPDQRDAGDHDAERGEAARQPDPHQPVDDRDHQRGDQQRDHDREHDHRQVADRQEDDRARGRR